MHQKIYIFVDTKSEIEHGDENQCLPKIQDWEIAL